MKAIRSALCALAAGMCLLASAVQATSFSTNQSDLWYIPGESGWGIQLVQAGSVIFGTMFVYDHAGVPTWYVATMQHAGNTVWSGDLLVTSGPWFGTVPFNPANVTARKVGTMQWAPKAVTSGTLTYVIDGVAVTKNVVRQTLVNDDFNGVYGGGLHIAASGCSNSALNATGETFVVIQVTQSGQNASILIGVLDQQGQLAGAFRVSGTFTQEGQFGRIVGTFDAGSETGSADMFEMDVEYNTFSARYSLRSSTLGCQYTGYLAGVRSRP